MNHIINLAIENFYLFLLVFARLGTAMMLFPGIGEQYVPARMRLLLGITMTFCLAPIVKQYLDTKIFDNQVEMIVIIGFEVFVGIFIGTIAKILVNITNIIGHIVATQIGLGSVTLFDPNAGTQGIIVGNFLSLLAMLLFFETNTHHLFIEGILSSYQMFAFHKQGIVSFFSDTIIKLVNDSFIMAFKISSPQVIVSLLLYIAAGVLSRLMPAMQIFFILMPAQLLIGFFFIMITLSIGMGFYIAYVHDVFFQIFD